MAKLIPKTTLQWSIASTDGPAALKLSEQPVPELGDNQVLVKRKSLTSPLSIRV